MRGREGKRESEREKLGPRPSTLLSSLSLTFFFPSLFLPPPPTNTIFPSPHLWLSIPVQHFQYRFISCLNINYFEKEPQEKGKKETRSSLSSLSLRTAAKRRRQQEKAGALHSLSFPASLAAAAAAAERPLLPRPRLWRRWCRSRRRRGVTFPPRSPAQTKTSKQQRSQRRCPAHSRPCSHMNCSLVRFQQYLCAHRRQ